MVQSGLLGACTIYDDRGRIVRSLFKNEMLGSSGSFTWDGLSDKHTKTGIGTYVAVFEAFSVDGGLMFSKTKAFVVAGKL
jgi:flagellar hook assembly protein FlgD